MGYPSGGGRGRTGNPRSRGSDLADTATTETVLLGLPVCAQLPGTSAAKVCGDTGAEDASCLLCCEAAPTYVGVGHCGHASVCSVCTLRSRALAQDRCCPVCKQELDTVLITSDATPKYPTLEKLELLPNDAALGVYFEDDAARLEGMRLFEYRCRIDECYCNGSAFYTLSELDQHLWYAHWRQFCRTCLHGKMSFICEQETFTAQEHSVHTHGGNDRSKQEGHPLCKFCNERFFDSEALLAHMHKQHHLCVICEQMGWPNEFFANIKCVAAHYTETHHVCTHSDCTHDGHNLAAFSNKDELALHTFEQHRSQMTDKAKKAHGRQTLQLGFLSYAEQQGLSRDNRQSSGSTSRGNARETPSSASAPIVRFSWPSGVHAASHSKAGQEEVVAIQQRYPKRDIIWTAAAVPASRHDWSHENSAEKAVTEIQGEVKHGISGSLDPRLEVLKLEVAYAVSGNQKNTRCFADAMHAVLHALCGQECLKEAKGGPFTKAVKRLTLANVDSLDNLRDDLGIGEGETEFDWEPLEHVLSLRPSFFRLLRADATARHGRQTLGPKVGVDPLQSAWRVWLIAAQAAVTSLGEKELLRLWIYVDLCIRWRGRMDNIAEESIPEPKGPTPSGPANKSTATQVPAKAKAMNKATLNHHFPTLGSVNADSADAWASSNSGIPSSHNVGGPSHGRPAPPPIPSGASAAGSAYLNVAKGRSPGATPPASSVAAHPWAPAAKGVSGRPHAKAKVSAGKKSGLRGVALNADKQPMLHKDEDLVLLNKHEDLEQTGMGGKNAFFPSKSDFKRSAQEEEQLHMPAEPTAKASTFMKEHTASKKKDPKRTAQDEDQMQKFLEPTGKEESSASKKKDGKKSSREENCHLTAAAAASQGVGAGQSVKHRPCDNRDMSLEDALNLASAPSESSWSRRTPPKAVAAKKSSRTTSVALNAEEEPMIHNDEDLVLLQKPEEDELSIGVKRTKAPLNANDCTENAQENCHIPSIAATSVADTSTGVDKAPKGRSHENKSAAVQNAADSWSRRKAAATQKPPCIDQQPQIDSEGEEQGGMTIQEALDLAEFGPSRRAPPKAATAKKSRSTVDVALNAEEQPRIHKIEELVLLQKSSEGDELAAGVKRVKKPSKEAEEEVEDHCTAGGSLEGLRPPVRELAVKTVSVKALPVKAPPVKALPAKGGKAPKTAKAAFPSNVVLNAEVEPIIHKDEDLVLLSKPSEEDLQAGSLSKNRSRKNDSDRRTKEDRDTAAAVAASLSAKPPLRSPPPSLRSPPPASQSGSAKDTRAFPGLPTAGPQPLSAAAKAGIRDRKAGKLR